MEREMRTLFLAACLLVPTVVSAEDSRIIGNFTHEFADKDEIVWVVKASGKQIHLLTTDPDTKLPVAMLSEQQRKDLWDILGFESEAGTHVRAECAGAANEYICYVPNASRAHVRVLKNRKTDYFHYDKVGGIMEIRKLVPKK